jgi:hypothetical protein
VEVVEAVVILVIIMTVKLVDIAAMEIAIE